MATIHEKQRLIKLVNLNKIGASIIADSKPELISKNKEQLMDSGVNKLGQKLRRYQSNSYAARKNKLNPFPGFGVPDLYRTGAFQSGFQLRINSVNTFELFSTDGKSKQLIEKYGKDIFGLTNESKAEYRKEVMQPELVKAVKQILKL